jgi:hypothetical protein
MQLFIEHWATAYNVLAPEPAGSKTACSVAPEHAPGSETGVCKGTCDGLAPEPSGSATAQQTAASIINTSREMGTPTMAATIFDSYATPLAVLPSEEVWVTLITCTPSHMNTAMCTLTHMHARSCRHMSPPTRNIRVNAHTCRRCVRTLLPLGLWAMSYFVWSGSFLHTRGFEEEALR